MPIVRFTPNLAKHRETPELSAEGSSVRDVMDKAFEGNALLRSYVLDEHGRLRKHVNIFVDGTVISDRLRLSDAVTPTSEIYVIQALSGG